MMTDIITAYVEDAKTSTGRLMLIEVFAHTDGMTYSAAEKKVNKMSASAIEKNLNTHGYFYNGAMKSWKNR